ncbi:hypothetical protein Ancab_033687 [Ancistrocladus abbreviatus]
MSFSGGGGDANVGSCSRVKAHLLKVSGFGISVCAKVTKDHLREMQKKVDEVEERVKKALPREVPLPTSSIASSTHSSSSSIQIGAVGSCGSLKLDGSIHPPQTTPSSKVSSAFQRDGHAFVRRAPRKRENGLDDNGKGLYWPITRLRGGRKTQLPQHKNMREHL